MSFDSKVVIVTGASSGIGAAIAIAFAKESANVIIVGRNEENLRKVAKQCEINNRIPYVINADITNENDTKRIIDETINKFNKLDILVNNAGILRTVDLSKDDNIMENYDEVMKTNVRSVVDLTRLATPFLIQSKGNIINISSISGRKVFRGQNTLYCMSKAALDHYMRGMAITLGKYGVRVNNVSPGPVKTDIFARAGITASFEEMGFKTLLDRLGEPEEIADIVIFLASDKAKGVTGSIYTSDNGYLLCMQQ
ncbi:3-oxoacyl-[acyl-carrier-protein] reductase FabG-like [Leptidea sinapis]|uniref:3-oxoacyl-[acyl-carrier-protein] reductase FabG-like n=1 Tax=Leptidea sinapis TaxID=189913 RepID=UPI0021C2F237|nr:3-oxoacyl-[acyl-carrier-protein] reductase FabG-like [Leptidea sinapis]